MKTRESADASKTGPAVVLSLLGLGLTLALIASWGRPQVRLKPAAVSAEPLLAVLPFESLSAEPEVEVLAMDLTAAVHQELTKLRSPWFRLAPREDAYSFKASTNGAWPIAEELGATLVLAGSLQSTTEELTIDAYLVHLDDPPELWAESFRFPSSARAEIPEKVALEIARALASPKASFLER